MKKFLKSNLKIFVLAIVTVAMGVLAFTSKTLSTSKSTKVDNNDSKEGYHYTTDGEYDYYYYEDDEDDYYNDDYYDNNYYDDDYYDNKYYYDDYYNTTNKTDKNTTSIPGVRYNSSINLNLFEAFDPYQYIETDGVVNVIYNDVNNTKVGNYSVQYSICNKYNKSKCRYIFMSVQVRDWDNSYSKYDEYDSSSASNVKWSNISNKMCKVGDRKCSVYNIDLPTAIDPYTNKELRVQIVSNNININKAGIYYIVYRATTSSGVSSSQTRQVQIYDDNNKTLSNTYNNRITTKQINNYEWKNVVTYSYQCINSNDTTANAWKYVEPLTNDDHPTFYYNQNGYSGILNKVSFYELNPYNGDIREQLGVCNRTGEIRTLKRTWIGVYSGTVTNYGN